MHRDLDMPVMDGRQVLAELVANEKLKHLPVVILTTSTGWIRPKARRRANGSTCHPGGA